VLRSNNIRNGRLSLDNPSYTDEQNYRVRVRRAVPSEGDIVITREAPMGELCMVPPRLKCCLGQRMVLLRPDRARVVPKFLLYALQSGLVQSLIQSHEGTGSTVSNLRIPALEGLTIPLVPKEQQEEVASLLGVLDDRIDNLRLSNEAMEAIARAIFKSWFVDFDPVRAKVEGREPEGMDADTAALFPESFQDSRGYMVPSGWKVVSIREIATLDKGLSYKGDFLGESGLPMINLGCFLGGGGFDLQKLKFYSGDFKPRHIVKGGGLVIANTDITQKRKVIGSPAIVPPSDSNEYLFTHHTFALRPTLELDGITRYLYFWLLQPSFRERAVGFATGTTVLALPRDAVLEHEVVLPEASVLNAFTDLVVSIAERVNNTSHQLSVLADLRDTLLPRLISGKLRVPEAEKLVEAVL
jgi:type I restriction enzyme S subunit